MHFDLTEEQEEFRGVVAEFFRTRFSTEQLRKIWEESPAETGLWPELAELGAVGMVVPEEYGGSGAGHVELALLLDEAGYAGFPEPLLETAGIAAAFILAWGDEETKKTWLPRIASGASRLSVVSGSKGYAPWGELVDAVIVPRGGKIHLVPADTVPWTPVRTQDPTRRVARADLSALSAATVLTDDPRAIDHFEALGQSATSAALVGLTRRVLDMTRAYVLQREQFGRLIGTFQVIKHRLAELAVRLEAARVLSWYAAYALGAGRPDARLAAMTAKSSANAAARFANRNGLQLHGGIGFTWEYDLHFWLMRGQAWEADFGREARLHVAIGRAIRDDGIRITPEDAPRGF